MAWAFLAAPVLAQVHPFEPGDAPLQLFISGSGRVTPFYSDQVLRTGKTYSMTAIPSPGQQFIGWNRVNVFKIIETLPNETSTWVTNTQVSPIPGFIPQRTLKFQATSPVMIFNEPGVRTIIGFSGWQANFSAEK